MTTENTTLFETLDAEIETRILPRTNYPYIPAAAIRDRLNKTFNCLWDTIILSEKVIDEETVLLKLRLVVGAGEEGVIRKEAFGSATIQKFSSGINKDKPVNLGDAYNNAVMDAIKACSKQLGIGNRQLDVIKDPQTGHYVEVSEQGTAPEKQPIDKKPGTKSKDETTDAAKTNKVIELKKRLEASKKKEEVVPESTDGPEPEVAEQKTSGVKEEAGSQPETEDSTVVDHGFDYEGLNGTTDSPKNTQKLVILNLAKMKGVTIEDYIEQVIGKQKSIDELTSAEAGLIVRSGLTSTTFK